MIARDQAIRAAARGVFCAITAATQGNWSKSAQRGCCAGQLLAGKPITLNASPVPRPALDICIDFRSVDSSPDL